MSKATKKAKKTVKRRPAETSSLVAAAVVTIGLWAFSLEPPPAVVSAMVLLVGAVPAAVTYFRER